MIIRRITLSLASLVLAFSSPLLHAQQAPVIAKKVTKMSMPMQAESLGTTMANESPTKIMSTPASSTMRAPGAS